MLFLFSSKLKELLPYSTSQESYTGTLSKKKVDKETLGPTGSTWAAVGISALFACLSGGGKTG